MYNIYNVFFDIFTDAIQNFLKKILDYLCQKIINLIIKYRIL